MPIPVRREVDSQPAIRGRDGLWLRYFVGLITTCVVASWPFSFAGAATPEYIAAEETAPESVEDAKQAVTEAFQKPVEEPSIFPRISEEIEDKPPFLRDTKLNAHVRSYYLETLRDGVSDSLAWALGNTLFDYESGLWRDRVKLAAVLYTSQPLYAPEDKDGTLLLAPGQEGFTVLGQANVKVRTFENAALQLGRVTYDVPYLNRNDSRMVPNTFESINYARQYNDALGYGVAHTTKIKARDSDRFVPMSEAAGFAGTNEPLTTAGIRYNIAGRTDIGVFNHYSWNYFNTLYAEGTGTFPVGERWDIRLSGQYTDQRSVGDEIGGAISTYVYGAKVGASIAGATFNFAFSSTGDGDRIRNPYGGYPGYLSLMLSFFNRAAEDAWLFGASYNFKRLGIPELSGFFNYARGNTPDSGVNASPDQQELDITLDYRVDTGRFKGLWFRLRGAWLNQEGPDAVDRKQARVIINLPIQIF